MANSAVLTLAGVTTTTCEELKKKYQSKDIAESLNSSTQAMSCDSRGEDGCLWSSGVSRIAQAALVLPASSAACNCSAKPSGLMSSTSQGSVSNTPSAVLPRNSRLSPLR